MNREPVFFENSEGRENVIAEAADMQETFEAIREFCHERNYNVRYTRFYIEDCPAEAGSGADIAWRLTFDVGSWSEFFHIYFDTFEQAEKFRATFD